MHLVLDYGNVIVDNGDDVECLPEGDEPVAFVSDEYNEVFMMGEQFGMVSVWVENDDATPYREPDARISTFTDLPDVLDTDGLWWRE